MRKKKKLRKTKLYIKYPHQYDWVEYSDGTRLIPVNIMMQADLLSTTTRGVPYECVIARGVMAFAKAHPEFFGHKVLYVYVNKTSVYIVDVFKHGRPSHAWRYQHTFSSLTKTFDKITPEAFLARYDGVGFNLKLKPARAFRQGEAKVGGNGTGGSRSNKASRGALARAIEAGLVPREPEPEMTV